MQIPLSGGPSLGSQVAVTLNIRGSMLPAYRDCPRRAAANQFRWAIENANSKYKLRKLKRGVGSAMGTALHASGAELQRQKLQGLDFSFTGKAFSNAVCHAVEVFQEEIKDGVEWDPGLTNNHMEAYAQLTAMTAALMVPCYTMQPEQIEQELHATVYGEDVPVAIDLSGHLDVRESIGWLWDIKSSGRNEPSPQAQLGCYKLLCDANGLPVNQVGMIFVKRVKNGKEQPAALRRVYDLVECSMEAWHAIQDIARDYYRFTQTGSHHEFPANPMSQMCSPEFCSAHGTPFCTVGKPKESKTK